MFNMMDVRTVLLCLILCFMNSLSSCELAIPGHLKPLGHHRKPSTGVTQLKEFPSPTEFYENYVSKSQPFVVKGVLEKGEFPAYKLWTDDYLTKQYGNVNIDVEGGKKENRDAQAYIMPMSKFLQIYNQSNIYMVFDVAEEMKADITVPISLQCGGLQDVIKSVIVWFSSGGTKSVLHNDGLDNINCLLDGKKDLIMIHKKYKDEIESDGFVKMGGYSKVDVESVDMEQFPKLRDLPWYMVNITKGDCLFIPYQWYHQVYSHSGRNLAINIWSSHLRWFNKTDCVEVEGTLKPKSLQDIDRELNADEGNVEEEIRDAFFGLFDQMEKIGLANFIVGIRENAPDEITDDVLAEIFAIMDTDRDLILSMEEIRVSDTASILELLPDIELLFGSSQEPTPDTYQIKEPVVLTKDDDLTFLIKDKNNVESVLDDSARNVKKDEL